jgi:hypothetical protein
LVSKLRGGEHESKGFLRGEKLKARNRRTGDRSDGCKDLFRNEKGGTYIHVQYVRSRKGGSRALHASVLGVREHGLSPTQLRTGQSRRRRTSTLR